jgi:glutamine synthetase
MGEASTISSNLPTSHPLFRLISSNPSCNFLRYHWVDYAGVLRVFIAPITHAVNLLNTGKVIQTGLHGINLPVSGDIPMYVLPKIFGKNELHPDWSSLRICEYAEGNAMVMCYLNETHPTAPHKYTMGFEHDPRTILSKVVAEAAEHNLNFLLGFELEFVLLQPSMEAHAPGTSSVILSMHSMRNKYLSLLEESVMAIQRAGIDICKFHTESGPAQFEMTTAPLPPMQAIDALIYSQETIKSIAFKHGVYATFHPKPLVKGNQKNGLHMHFSVESLNKSFSPDRFLAGLLKHLRAMCMFIMPNTDSYERVQDLFSDKAAWVCWGTENKSAPIRQIRPGYWELRKIDACANPYLSVAAHIVAGMSGLAAGEELAIKDCELVVGNATDEELAKHGITERLPASMTEAIQACKEDAMFRERFGDAFIDRLILQRTWEENSLRKMNERDRRLLLVSMF